MAGLEIAVMLAGEDEMHRSLGQALVSRAFGSVRFVGLEPKDEGFFFWQGVEDRLRRELRLAPGKPMFRDRSSALGGHPRARLFVDIVMLAEAMLPAGHILVLLEDTDGKEDLPEAAAAAGRWFMERERRALALVIGTPHQDAESWVVAGLASEAAIAPRRAAAKRRLGFDPCQQPHRLTHAPNDAERDAKRVLRFLLGEGRDLRAVESKPPPPETHEELTDRAFSQLDKLVGTGVARDTLLAVFWEDLQRAVRLLSLANPAR